MGGDHALIFLDQRGDGYALRGAEGVVGRGAVFLWIDRFRVQRFSVWGLPVQQLLE